MRDDIYNHYVSEIARFYNDKVFNYEGYWTNQPNYYVRFYQMYRYATPIYKNKGNNHITVGISLNPDNPDIEYDDPTSYVYDITVVQGIHGNAGVNPTVPSPYKGMNEWFYNYTKKEHIKKLFDEAISNDWNINY